MLSKIEKFIAGEVVISLTNNEIPDFFRLMNMINFSSIEEHSQVEIIQKNVEDLVVQYLPNLGFRFISLNELKSELSDIISDDIIVMKLDEIFNIAIPSVA